MLAGTRPLFGVGVGFARAITVVIRIEGGEAEELLDVGGNVRADEVFAVCKRDRDRGQRKVVFLVGATVKLVTDEGGLGLGERNVAGVDAVGEGVRLAVGAAAGLRVEELVVPDEGDVVRRDASVGLDGVNEVVEAGLERGERVFGAQVAAAAMSLDVEVLEAGGGLKRSGTFFREDRLEEVRAVGDQTVHAGADHGAHLPGVVGRPRNDLYTLCVQGIYRH